ncbi:MAG TPA: hypothetical protein VGA16_07275 [Candidatus Limnocylindria bacterium]
MIRKESTTAPIARSAVALLAAALIACGTVTGASAGRAVHADANEAPSDVHLTEFEYAGQSAARTTAPTAGGAGPSEASGSSDGPFLIP